ncbi:MAG: tetratricopeptide repeat protein [Saprospiraceae bacterium]|nr:tetratricopeptide repeat protein [Saprospiraceae bacterium]
MNIKICLLILLPLAGVAQNTIGGAKITVPEAEVKRQSQFLTAEKERLLNHNEKALELYKKFTYDFPSVDAGWYGLARTQTALRDLPSALESIGKAVALTPNNEWYLVYQADLFEKTGRIGDAVKTYENLVKLFPNTPEFYEQLAYLSLKNEDPKRGLKALDKWEGLVGIREEIIFKRHVIFVGLGDLKKAATEYKRLADAFPNEVKYRLELAAYLDKIGDKTGARQAYEEVLRKQPENATAKMALATGESGSDAAKLQTYRALFDDPMVPIDEKVKALMPFFPKLSTADGASLQKTILELGALLEKHHADDAKAWSLSGDLFYHLNRPSEALERYRKCIQLNPTVFAVWDNTLDLLLSQGQFDEMLSTAEKAMDAFPNQPKAYYYYGIAANIKGRSADALGQLEQGLLMVSGNQALRLDMLDQIGLALMGKKDFEAAITRYQKALPLGGDQHPGILEHLGDALAITGKTTEAVEYWKKANAIRPSPALEQKIASGKM